MITADMFRDARRVTVWGETCGDEVSGRWSHMAEGDPGSTTSRDSAPGVVGVGGVDMVDVLVGEVVFVFGLGVGSRLFLTVMTSAVRTASRAVAGADVVAGFAALSVARVSSLSVTVCYESRSHD